MLALNSLYTLDSQELMIPLPQLPQVAVAHAGRMNTFSLTAKTVSFRQLLFC